MNLVIHQLKKDLYRMRVPLALWLALAEGPLLLTGWNVQPDDLIAQQLRDFLFRVFFLFERILAMVIVSQTLQQEPTQGVRAFWFTRPLSRGTILGAKGLFILILVAVPVLVQSLALAANGVTARDIALASQQIFLSQLSLVLMVAAVAVLTPSFSRFVIVTVAILFGSVLLSSFFNYTHFDRDASRTILMWALSIGFGSAVVIHQYLTRRTVSSIVLLAVGASFYVASAYFWPWDFMKPPVHALDPVLASAEIGLALASDIKVNEESNLRGGAPGRTYRTNLALLGLPDGYFAGITETSTELKLPDGTRKTFHHWENEGTQDFPSDSIETALSGATLLNAWSEKDPQAKLFHLDDATWRQYGAQPVDVTDTIRLATYKYVIDAELPLAKRAHIERGSEHLEITDILHKPAGLRVILRDRDVNLLFSRKPEKDRTESVYVLWNRKKGEAMVEKRDYWSYSGGAGGILRNQLLRASFGPDKNDSDENDSNASTLPLTEAWLADAVLIRLKETKTGALTKTLHLAAFRLDRSSEQYSSEQKSVLLDQFKSNALDNLEKIVLPENPTREQTRAYVVSILKLSQRAGSARETAMIERVGSQNVDLLIDLARTWHNYYLAEAINHLAQPDHKELILSALPANTDLIYGVIAHQWQQDAKPILLEAFADPKKNVSWKWFETLASFHDPATYGVLRNYFLEHPSRDLADILKKVPDFDLNVLHPPEPTTQAKP